MAVDQAQVWLLRERLVYCLQSAPSKKVVMVQFDEDLASGLFAGARCFADPTPSTPSSTTTRTLASSQGGSHLAPLLRRTTHSQSSNNWSWRL